MTTEIVSGAALAGAALASARWPWWRRSVKGLPVLTYRVVGDPPPGSSMKSSWVAAGDFRAHLSWLRAEGYSTLLFSDVLAAMRSGRRLPARSVLMTFDGAYRDTCALAYPALREFGAKANVFVAFNYIGKADLWKDAALEAWVPMAPLATLKEMRDSGLVEFGSMTMNHVRLDALPPDDAAWEIAESRRQLGTALGREICAFAYPWGAGSSSDAVRSMAERAGYALDFSLETGKGPVPGAWADGARKRLPVRRGDKALDLKLLVTRGAARLI